MTAGFVQDPDCLTRFSPTLPGTGLTLAYEDGVVTQLRQSIWDMLRVTVGFRRRLAAIELPSTTELSLRKAKPKNILAPLPTKGTAGHLLHHFYPNDRDKIIQFQEDVKDLTERVIRETTAMFPYYKVIGSDVTWRLTRTDFEEFHFDYYGDGPNDAHHVRLFANLDSQPRLWGIGPKIETAIYEYPVLARGLGDLDANTFARRFSELLPWDQIPKHFIAFPPGAVWLVDSRKVSHAILYGRKMLTCSLMIDPTSMRDSTKGFVATVGRALRAIPG